MQASHQTSDMYWAGTRLGPTRLLGAYAWRSLLDNGCDHPERQRLPGGAGESAHLVPRGVLAPGRAQLAAWRLVPRAEDDARRGAASRSRSGRRTPRFRRDDGIARRRASSPTSSCSIRTSCASRPSRCSTRRCSRRTSAARPSTSGRPSFRDARTGATRTLGLIRIALLVGVLAFGGIVWYLRRTGDASYPVNPRGAPRRRPGRVGAHDAWHARAVRCRGTRVARAARDVSASSPGRSAKRRRSMAGSSGCCSATRSGIFTASRVSCSRTSSSPSATLVRRARRLLSSSATEIVAALGRLDAHRRRVARVRLSRRRFARATS